MLVQMTYKSNINTMDNSVQDTTSQSHSIFCYSMGDFGKKHQFMSFRGVDRISDIAQLTDKDFALVKRSNGEWQLSIVVETSKTDVLEDMYIKFLLDDKGHTKTVPFHQWTKLIRLVRRPQDFSTRTSSQDLTDQIKNQAYKRSVSWAGFSDNDCHVGISFVEAAQPIRYDLKDKRRVSLQSHQRAFLSALASIDHNIVATKSSRSVAARFA
ncbi:hypothetical protein ACHAW6_005013 [Cyclotella cf. meneghiniana]